MDVLNIVAVCVFIIVCALAMWQGERFLSAPLWVRATIVTVLGVSLVLWIWHVHQTAEEREPIWNDTEIAWEKEQFPLVLKIDEDLRGQAVDNAINLWNKAAGCSLLTQNVGNRPWNIEIVIGDYNADYAGRAWKSTTNRIKIEVNNPGHIGQQYLIIAHELGHALSLAHDFIKTSVMTSGVQVYADEFPLPGVTRKDKAALRQRYCK